MTIGPGEHSPVGASAIKRVLSCPASVGLAHGIIDEESEHAALGTAVHSVIEECFRRSTDAWTMVGSNTCEDYPINKQMANSAQVMLDAVRKAHPDRNQSNFWVERRFHCPTIHPLFFGTSDVVFLDQQWAEDRITCEPRWILHIWDYKNGAGVVVEVEENEQLMYYACGALEDLGLWDKVDTVVLHVVQPNGFHYDGPVRGWTTTPDHLVKWMEDTLVVGIEVAVAPNGWTGKKCLKCAGQGENTEEGYHCLSCGGTGEENVSQPTNSGEHCRFCPVRTHACPQLLADVAELEVLMAEIEKKGADALTGEQLSRFLNLKVSTKIVFAAAESTAFKRIQGGARIEGWKLAKAGADRQWKAEADLAALKEFGDKAMTAPKAKSPAQIEELPGGTEFTARWAFKPDAGLKLYPASSKKAEVSTDTKSLFTAVAKAVTPAPQPIVPPPASGRRKPSSLSLVQ